MLANFLPLPRFATQKEVRRITVSFADAHLCWYA